MSRQDNQALEAAIWQDVEFGSHTADLSVWEELEGPDRGPVLELGAGAGRVALHLARRGTAVIACESDDGLSDELRRRAGEAKLPVTCINTDLTAIRSHWPEEMPAPAGVIAPLHVVQQVPPDSRSGLLSDLAGLLGAGGRFAATLVDEVSLFNQGAGGKPAPDMREIDGWTYSSEPLWVQVGEAVMTVRRLRQRVSPGGEIERSVDDQVLYRLAPEQLESEAAAAGLHPLARRTVDAGPREADSIAVIMERREDGRDA